MFNVHFKRKQRLGKAALMRTYDYVMDAVAFLSPFALTPQVISIYATHEVSGLSLLTWLLFSSLNALWIIYGVARSSSPIIIANVLSGFLNVAGALGIVLFR